MNADEQRVYDNVFAQLNVLRGEVHRLQSEANKVTVLYGEAYRRADGLQAQLAQAHAERASAQFWRDNFKSDLDAAHTSLSAAITAGKSIAADRDKAVRLYHDTLAERDAARAEVARLTAALHVYERMNNTDLLRGQPAPARAEAEE